MAKKQSALRNAVDAVFGSSQYLTYDGSAYAKSKYAQIFNRVSKPQYLLYATGVALEVMIGTPETITDYGVGLACLALLDKFETMLPSRVPLKDLYYDTKAENRGFVEPAQASALRTVKRSGAGDLTICAVFSGMSLGASMATGEPISSIPFFCAMGTWGFGNYWRPKQVLDGNWTLLDKAPPEKQASKVSEKVPANAVPIRIHNCEMPPALEL